MSDKEKTTIRSKGGTVDDAVNEALLRLGARRDEVEITVIEEGKPGVLGVFGRKRAEVEVTRKAGGRSRGGRSRDRDKDRDRGGRRERGGRRDRKDRDDGARADSRNERPRNDQPRPERKDDDGEGRPRRRRRPARDDKPAEQAAPRDERRDKPQKQEAAAADTRRRDGEKESRDGDGEPRRRRRRRGGRRRRRRSDGDAPATEDNRQAAASSEPDGNRIPEEPRNEPDGNRMDAPDPEAYGPQFDEDGKRLPRQRRSRRERRPRDERPAAATVEKDVPVKKSQPETPMPPMGEPIAVAATTAGIASADVEAVDANVQAITEELLRRCGFFASVRLLEKNDDDRLPVRAVVDAESVEAMVGRRNSAISSVQHLVERLNQKSTGEFQPLDMDINNYRQRQDGKLTRLAQDAIGRVQQSGDEDHLPPMNARDRRMVHMEVAEVDGLHTYTVGQGMDRHVVICVDKGDDNPPSEPDAPRR